MHGFEKLQKSIYLKIILKAIESIPASIAFGHPNTDLSGIFLKPLRAWDYPNKLPFVPKRRCLLVHNSSIPLAVGSQNFLT